MGLSADIRTRLRDRDPLQQQSSVLAGGAKSADRNIDTTDIIHCRRIIRSLRRKSGIPKLLPSTAILPMLSEKVCSAAASV